MLQFSSMSIALCPLCSKTWTFDVSILFPFLLNCHSCSITHIFSISGMILKHFLVQNVQNVQKPGSCFSIAVILPQPSNLLHTYAPKPQPAPPSPTHFLFVCKWVTSPSLQTPDPPLTPTLPSHPRPLPATFQPVLKHSDPSYAVFELGFFCPLKSCMFFRAC